MKNKPAILVSAVVLSLVVITAVATVTSTSPKPDTETAAIQPDSPELAENHGDNPVARSNVQPEQAQVKPANVKPPTKIAWETSFEGALKKAKASGKPVMVDFYADWCGACKHLDANIYTAAPVIVESANFINVKVDADKRTDLQSKYQVDGLPTILWFNSEGNEIKRLQGAPHEADYMVDMMKEALNQPKPESVL